jgi:endoribonuclease Dicer
LASIAVKRLDLHRILLINNVELGTAIGRYAPILQEITDTEIITKGWKHDPPKAMSDVLESVLGAVLVDSAYNLDLATAVVEFVMGDVLEALTPNLPRDPVSQLMITIAKEGCRQIFFR